MRVRWNRVTLGLVWALGIGSPALAGAQAPGSPVDTAAAVSRPAVAAAAPPDTAALLVQNRVVFVFRSPLGARSAAERARAAAERIRTLAERTVTGAIAVRLVPEGMLVSVGPNGVFAITPADLDPSTGESLDEVGARAVRQLRVALAAERDQRNFAHTVRAIVLVILATLMFALAIRLLRVVRRLVLTRIPVVAGPRLPDLSFGGFTLFTATQVLGFLRRLLDLVWWALGLFAAYLWMTFVLTRFPYTAPWGEALGDYLIATVRGLALGALRGIPGLFTVVLIFLGTRFLTRIVDALFRGVEAGEVAMPWVHPETAQPTRRLVTVLLWLFAVVVAYPYLPGSDSDAFKGVSVFVGLVLSLGSSGLVNQAMSGLVVMYARAFRPGDYVRVGEIEGVVTELGLLSTKIRTNKREEVTIPNAVLVSTTAKNYSRLSEPDGVFLHTAVTIGYDTPWRQVHALLESAATRTPGVRRVPPAFVRQTALGDFAVSYELNASLERPQQRLEVLSALHANIQDCFSEAGVQIMSPHYEGDPERPKIASPGAWPPPHASGRPVQPIGDAGHVDAAS